MAKKEKSIGELIGEINKQESNLHKVIKTDIPSIDYILGGGIELGSKIQFVAESSTGKTTIALQICKIFCQKGYDVLYIDTENSVSKQLLKSTGCREYCNLIRPSDDGNLVLIKESEFDAVSKKIDEFISLNRFKLVVIDSLANLVNNCYTNIDSTKGVKAITNNNTNYESRPLNLFINKYSSLAKKYNFAILYINQYRNKIDMFKGTILKEYGNKIVRYDSDIIVKIKKDKEGYRQDENGILTSKNTLPYTHNKLILSLDKSNKLLSGETIETYIKYGYGIDENLDEILSLVRDNLIQKKGKYYVLYDNQNIDGLENLINIIYSDKAKFNEYYDLNIEPVVNNSDDDLSEIENRISFISDEDE